MTEKKEAPNTPLIKTPKQLIIAIIAGFLIPVACIILLVQYVAQGNKTGIGSQAQSDAAVHARLQPVAQAGFNFQDANAPRIFLSGEKVYQANCAACHATGSANAPKVGDVAAWAPRLAEGEAAVYKIALEGRNAMPAKGGNPNLDAIEVQRAVVYMVNLSGGNFKEPALPASPDSAENPT